MFPRFDGSVFLFWIALLTTTAVAQESLPSRLSAIEQRLAPHRGETGKKTGMKAIETALSKLQPILDNEGGKLARSDQAMKEALRIGALFCSIDPSYQADAFLLELRASKKFMFAFNTLSKADRNCITRAFVALRSKENG